MKTILVPFGGLDAEIPALGAAFQLARRFNAHVTCLHVVPDPQSIIYASMGAPVYLPASVLDQFENTIKEQADRALYLARKEAEHYGVQETGKEGLKHHPSVHFMTLTGAVDLTVARFARFHDLTVMAKAARDQNPNYAAALTEVVVHAAKPLLYVPSHLPPVIDQTIALAWSNAPEAAHALTFGLPLFTKAEKRYFLSVHPSPQEHEDFALLLDYLQHHDTDGTLISFDQEPFATGMQLLEKAHSLGSTLLMMGAFTHPRLQQMFMGGVTKFMLDHADRPVLMVH